MAVANDMNKSVVEQGKDMSHSKYKFAAVMIESKGFMPLSITEARKLPEHAE